MEIQSFYLLQAQDEPSILSLEQLAVAMDLQASLTAIVEHVDLDDRWS